MFWNLRAKCGVCGDKMRARDGGSCGRCHGTVCRACSHVRGRTHETVLCTACAGDTAQHGIRATRVYRSWKRMRAA